MGVKGLMLSHHNITDFMGESGMLL